LGGSDGPRVGRAGGELADGERGYRFGWIDAGPPHGGAGNPGPWVRSRSTRLERRLLRPRRSGARRIGAAHRAVPRARGPAHRPHPVPRQPGARHDQPRDPAMNEILRDRLLRKLDALPDDKAYQVLDYVEFLESKYAERPAGAPPFQRVAETLEDTLRAGRV